ncbi:MAG: histidine--tRNA ligase [Candidatus Kapabacteria bacterium]|nr:histidine--tRNA ligase [Candidatus Kapabacteria bacterium]
MIQSVKGTKDILPDSIAQWQFLENQFRIVSAKYGYREIRTPVFEKTEVFSRGIGEETDIVNKEMYTFADRNGDLLTLRPEMTAPLVRAVIQNNLLEANPTLKLWYAGPLLRYERPQKGRMRQFHQYGAECIGTVNPEADVELLLLADCLIKSVGIQEYRLLLNTLGNDNVRLIYKNELINYLSKFKEELSEESKNRLDKNPLRVLDSKHPADAQIIAGAPQILDFLDEESASHFNFVRGSLDALNIKYEITPRLVRGLDYYCHTVFEFQSSALGAQDSFGGGGRYNKLFEELGGKACPAVGFAFGIERILIILEAINKLPQISDTVHVSIINLDVKNFVYAQNIAEQLRAKGLNVACDLQRRSMKAQMREANRLNVKYAIIIGPDEVEKQTMILKNMSDASQREIGISEINSLEI